MTTQTISAQPTIEWDDAARNKTSINIVYDDAVDKPYTTLTNQSFPLQQLSA